MFLAVVLQKWRMMTIGQMRRGTAKRAILQYLYANCRCLAGKHFHCTNFRRPYSRILTGDGFLVVLYLPRRQENKVIFAIYSQDATRQFDTAFHSGIWGRITGVSFSRRNMYAGGGVSSRNVGYFYCYMNWLNLTAYDYASLASKLDIIVDEMRSHGFTIF